MNEIRGWVYVSLKPALICNKAESKQDKVYRYYSTLGLNLIVNLFWTTFHNSKNIVLRFMHLH